MLSNIGARIASKLADMGIKRGLSLRFAPSTALVSNRSVDIREIDPHKSYSVRRATTADIPDIKRLNLENLPENYTSEFFYRFLRSWPELSIVAESSHDRRLIGYALGRVELRRRHAGFSFQSQVPHMPSMAYQGHVTSIAVSNKYRGSGIGKRLMKTLHDSFIDQYSVEGVSLHVRQRNIEATSLYRHCFSYELQSVVKDYYDDGEDALLLYMAVKQQQQQQQQQ